MGLQRPKTLVKGDFQSALLFQAAQRTVKQPIAVG
ncbi:hypothetical protein MAMT_01158 [Methylacidimicrobium tartarophylax]|uniref:Uncharacterized protein n=1 Tax=Methylacidimicrobium tartarophylax TaxID=1041768 RepID=A0A5E6MBM8_9BACT|nr:hypothetical protein MAMT_01158 [Methylacidimicrobium tartarophylax]